eukprot:4909997-Prymnesium_polylepis.1
MRVRALAESSTPAASARCSASGELDREIELDALDDAGRLVGREVELLALNVLLELRPRLLVVALDEVTQQRLERFALDLHSRRGRLDALLLDDGRRLGHASLGPLRELVDHRVGDGTGVASGASGGDH